MNKREMVGSSCLFNLGSQLIIHCSNITKSTDRQCISGYIKQLNQFIFCTKIKYIGNNNNKKKIQSTTSVDLLLLYV